MSILSSVDGTDKTLQYVNFSRISLDVSEIQTQSRLKENKDNVIQNIYQY